MFSPETVMIRLPIMYYLSATYKFCVRSDKLSVGFFSIAILVYCFISGYKLLIP